MLCAGVRGRSAESPYFYPGAKRTAGTRHHGRKALFSTGANILVAEADTGKADKGLEQNV